MEKTAPPRTVSFVLKFKKRCGYFCYLIMIDYEES